jgi:hypothetical protein
LTFLGALTVTLPESAGPMARTALYAGIVDGRGFANNGNDTTSYYAGLTIPTPIETLAVGAAFDYVEDLAANQTPVDNENWAWALAGYISYQASEQLRLNARGDWARGSNGTWYTSTSFPSDHNELLGVTLTADYSLWSGLMTRLEGRWDHALENDGPFGSDGENVFTLALNLIYKF